MNDSLARVAWTLLSMLAGIGVYFLGVTSGYIGQVIFGGS